MCILSWVFVMEDVSQLVECRFLKSTIQGPEREVKGLRHVLSWFDSQHYI